MFELLLICLMLLLSHMYVNIGRIVKPRGHGMHLVFYFCVTISISIPTVFVLYNEMKYNPKGALFCVVVTIAAYYLSRKPVERLVERLNL